MKKLAISVLVVAAAACSDDAAKGQVDTANAKASVEELARIHTSMAASNGADAADALQALTSAGQALVVPTGQAGRQLGLLPESFPRPTIANAIGGSAVCSATSCTFTNYGDDTAGSAWLINGTITQSGDTTSFDIRYTVTLAGLTLDWTIDGDVTVNATSIDGNVHSHGTTALASGSNTPGVNVTWDTAVDYNHITLDAQGCPTGGGIHAAVSYSANSGGNSGSFDVQGGASFGPTCGQVTAN